MNNLNRFLQVQEFKYDIALKEIKNGRKESHWMWYIFPQILGLGFSENAIFYSIYNQEEAESYMNNEILRKRLLEITNEVLKLKETDIEKVFGSIDSIKLKSSMTLFNIVAPEEEVFKKVLDKYFNGEEDQKTLEKLGINIDKDIISK